jgi:uncharacterized protein YkuJ
MHKVLFNEIDRKVAKQHDSSKVYSWLMSLRVTKAREEEIPQVFIDGTLLCQLVHKLEGRSCSLGYHRSPKTLSACRANIRRALDYLGKSGKFKSLHLWSHDLIIHGDDEAIWSLLKDIMAFYTKSHNPTRPQTASTPADSTELPYQPFEIKQLQHSIFKWVYSIKPFSQNVPENFESLTKLLQNGNVLATIVTKVTKNTFKLIKFPTNKKECLDNIDLVLSYLRDHVKMSQNYTKEPCEIYNNNQMYVLGLLEDLHRLYHSLPPRKPGPGYHLDGPFFGNFGPDSLNLSKAEEKTFWTTKSAFMSPMRSKSISKNFAGTRNGSPLSLHSYSTIRNSLDPGLETISPKQKRNKTENLLEFRWLKHINVSLPKNLDLSSDKISEFRNGELLCRIVELLDGKDLKGVQKAKKETAAAAKNVAIAFDALRSKPSFSNQLCYCEAQVLAGNGDCIRLVLKEIHRVYKNSIITLTKFNKLFKPKIPSFI